MKFKKAIALLLTVTLVLLSFSATLSVSSETAEETYDTYDELTLSDLGLNPGDFENSLTAGSHSYTAVSASHSVTIKFKWEPHLDGTDKTSWFLALDFDYNYRAGVWFRGNDIRFCYDSNNKTAPGYKKLTAITSGRHTVEFGRKLVISGQNEGKYFVYFIVDEEVLASAYIDDYTASDYNSGNGMKDKVYLKGGSFPDQRFADVKAEETFDTYDELTLSDLGLNPGDFENSLAAGSHSYTAVSTSHSVAIKFEWEPHLTAGSDSPSWFLALDFDYNYRAGVWFRGSDIRFCYNSAKTDPYQKLTAITGGRHTVEFGRKLVLTGKNKGKYFVYLIVDEEVLASGYTDEYAAADYNSGNGMKDKVFLNGGGFSAQRFANAKFPETYCDYDEIEYEDLLSGGNPLADETTMGSKLFTYNRTSTTGSAILKYRWKAKAGSRFQLSFDSIDGSKIGYMFGAQLYVADETHPNGYIYLRPGYGSKIKVGLSKALEDGDVYDVEFARLKVKEGKNAGKYYVYIKIGDIAFAEDYVDANVVNQDGSYTTNPDSSACNVLSGEIYLTFWGVSGNKITHLPYDETYEQYDEIGYMDLMDESGNALDENAFYNGSTIFTYNRTSPTGSAILKYRWTVGTIPKFQLSFDYAYESNGTTKAMDYMFGVQVSAPSDDYPNGEIRLRPGYGSRLNLPSAFEPENIYDIEFARLKVATGPNKGKYYVYVKVDGVLLSEGYTDAGIVDSNNHYITRPGVDGTTDVAISNKIFLAFWGSYNNQLSQTWDNGKGYYVSYYANGKLVEKVPFTFDNPTVEGKEPAVPVLPNATGVWESHPVSGLTNRLNVNAVYTVTAPETAGTNISLNTYNGATVDLKTDIVNTYLGLPMEQQSDYARNYSTSTNGYQDHQNISFSWTDIGNNSSYTVYFADNEAFDNAFIVTANSTELVNKVGIFVPGKTYYWFVAGNNTGECSAVDSFTALENSVRYITAGAVTNMRDLGGYAAADGKTVSYGLVYRGSALDEEHSHIDDAARNVFNYLGMNSEIELRGSYTHTVTGWDNSNKNVYHINAVNYSPILSLDEEQKAQYKETFEAMADRSNYPFYFHCSAGADRTGTFAYLLNGLLGVSYEDLREDYELTSFSEIGRRPADHRSDDDSFDQMHASLMAQYADESGSISGAIENFLIQYIGLEKSTLDSIREIMLESNTVIGDGNNDGKVDANDLTVLISALITNSEYIEILDVNADNCLDIRDLITLKKYLADNTVVLGKRKI